MSAEKRKRRSKKAPTVKAANLLSPFDLTANLYAYVPREAIESCLRFTVRALRRGETCVVITGPAGIGKTLLLHMIGDRIGQELGVVYLPYAALPPEDLCTWALGRMERPHGDDSLAALTEYARELGAEDKALLLLLDDASTMAPATARWLSELTAELDGALRLVVAATDGPNVDTLTEALGKDIESCRLDQPMTLEETHTYVTTRLELAMAPDSTCARFDDATIESIHRAAAGNPRQLHQVASAVMRGLSPDSIEFETENTAVTAEAIDPANKAAEKKKRKPRKKRKVSTAKKTAAAESTAPPAANEPSAAALYDTLPTQPEATASPSDTTRPEPARQPQLVALSPASALRIFRSFGIIAAALVAMVLARPVAPLDRPTPKVTVTPQVVATISTKLPSLPDGIIPPKPAPKPATALKPAPSGRRVGPLSVQVNATPWARIWVDGIGFGATPVADIPLLPGEHTFLARMPDGRTLEKVVDIDESRRFVTFE